MSNNPWIIFVRAYAKKNNISYACAISEAKEAYRKKKEPEPEPVKKEKEKIIYYKVKDLIDDVYQLNGDLYVEAFKYITNIEKKRWGTKNIKQDKIFNELYNYFLNIIEKSKGKIIEAENVFPEVYNLLWSIDTIKKDIEFKYFIVIQYVNYWFGYLSSPFKLKYKYIPFSSVYYIDEKRFKNINMTKQEIDKLNKIFKVDKNNIKLINRYKIKAKPNLVSGKD
jgi:ABC-type dipeptide/oligopeptide/nickel transport system permease component